MSGLMTMAAMCLALGCSPKAESTSQDKESQFLAEFKAAYQAGDKARIMALVYSKDMPAELRGAYETTLTQFAGKHKMTSARLVPWSSSDSDHGRFGERKVKANLTPSYWLEFSSEGHEGFNGSASSWGGRLPVGEENGKLFICGELWDD